MYWLVGGIVGEEVDCVCEEVDCVREEVDCVRWGAI